MPSVSPNPGMMLRRPSACTCAIAMASASGSVDLVEYAAVGEMSFLHFAPAAQLVDVHEFELREALAAALREFRLARAEVESCGDFLRLGRIQKLHIGLRNQAGTTFVDHFIDHRDRGFGQ